MSTWRSAPVTTHWLGFVPVVVPTPPPKLIMVESGSSTVFRWLRATFMDFLEVHGPLDPFDSSKDSVVFVASPPAVLPLLWMGFEPPISSTLVEPPGPPGTSTAEPHTRRRLGSWMSSQLPVRSPAQSATGSCRNQESDLSGPATIMRPLFIQNRCG